VNLGGWLLWECGICDQQPLVQAADRLHDPPPMRSLRKGRWIGNLPMDEWTLSLRLRERLGNEEAERVVSEHRATFITKNDFEDIKALGLDAVRVPFSYWLVVGPREGEPFVGPDLGALDRAFEWAQETSLKVILSFHGTVGFQSTHQACGRADEKWDPRSWDPEASLKVLQQVAARYRRRRCLGGITVVNEPSKDIPLEVLLCYYKDAYHVIRSAGVPETVQIILPVFHRPVSDFRGHFPKDVFHNVVFDVHVYQVFGEDWCKMSLADHLRWASAEASNRHTK